MPEPYEQVVDGEGTPLQTGDRVASMRHFDRGYTHIGVVSEIHPGGNRITVRHRDDCEPGYISEDCHPKSWRRLIKRPTAWARLLSDEGEGE
jgi:hypothetical protein